MNKSIFLIASVLITSATIAQQKQEKKPPPPPPPKVNVEKFVPPPPPSPPSLPDDYKAFLKRNPTVKGVSWMDKNKVRIRLKTGKEELYNLNNESDAQKLKNTYGDLPAPPPPPPPPKVRN